MVARLVAFALSLILIGQGLTLHHSPVFAIPVQTQEQCDTTASATEAFVPSAATIATESPTSEVDVLTACEVYADQSIDALEEGSQRRASRARAPLCGAPSPTGPPFSLAAGPAELLRPPQALRPLA